MILVYGTVCLDRIHQVDRLPKPGGYVEIQNSERQLGGEALNTATALHKWQTDFRLAGNALGDSTEAQWMRRAFQAMEFPNLELPEEENAKLPICDIFVTPDGERTMFGIGFAELPENAHPEQVTLDNADWMTVDGNLGSAATTLTSLAKAKGIRSYSMDVESNKDLGPNDAWQTSTDLVGRKGDIQRNLKFLQSKIDELGCLCIHSDGANGFIAGSPTLRARHYPPFPAPKVVDSTGAGDSFRAGMLFGLDQDWPVSDCLKFASATGCLNCRAFGAVAGLPTVQEVKDLIASHPEISRAYD